MTLLTAGYLSAGLALLALGAESLVRGAVQLATRLGISRLVMFSSGLPSIALLRHAMSWYALPLTAATLPVIFLRAWQRQR